jgi:hypothetical protein
MYSIVMAYKKELTTEELKEIRRGYNRKYYGKKADDLKAKRDREKKVDDEVIDKFIRKVGWERILKHIVLK